MPLSDIQRHEGPDQELATFAEGVGKFWELVTSVVLTRLKRPAREIFRAAMVPIYNPDGSVKDTSLTDLRQVLQIAKADSQKAGQGTYKVAVWGHREPPNKRRKVVAPPEELHSQTFQFGEADDTYSEDARGVQHVLKEAATLIRAGSNSAADHAVTANTLAEGYNKLISVQQGIIVGLGAVAEQSREESRKHDHVMVELKKLEIDFETAKETWRREDARAAADNALESERSRNYHGTLNHFIDSAKGPLMDILRLELLKRGVKHPPGGSADGSSSAGGEATATGLGPDLKAFLDALEPPKPEQLKAQLGERVWDLVVGAASKTDDDEVREIFKLIEVEFQGDPREAKGDPRYAGSKDAAKKYRERVVKALPTILGIDDFQKLVMMLVQGGVALL